MNGDLQTNGPGIPVITVRPRPTTVQPQAQPEGGDAWSAFPDEPPKQPAAQPAPVLPADAWSAFPDKPPEKPPTKPARDVGRGEAASAGAREALSFGFDPALQGLAEVTRQTGSRAGNFVSGVVDELNPLHQIVGSRLGLPSNSEIVRGIANLIMGHMTGDQTASQAYERGRQQGVEAQEAAAEQRPGYYAGGQVAASLAVPAGGGAGALARVARTAATSAAVGGLTGVGTGVSQEQSPAETAIGAAQGAGSGALFGAAGGGLAEGTRKVFSRIGSLFRGARSDEGAQLEAQRKIVEAIRADHQAAEEAGRNIRLDPAAIAAAHAAGTPTAIVDTGGERTRALFRSSANVSPEAREAAEDFTSRRYRQQSQRVAPYVRDLAGGMTAGDDVEAIKAAARQVNKTLYDRAYKAGDRPITVSKALLSSEALPKAMAGAIERGRNRAALDGYAAFNPRVQVTADGMVHFPRDAKGLPTYPNLQFWDYTQRELRDMATAAERAGRNEEAATLKGLHHELMSQLDKQVPAFGDARGVAARFFGAADAWDAGAEFVRRNVDFRESARLLAQMQGPERELFARGFATRLADEIEKAGDRGNVLDSIFLDSPAAKRKIQMALGPERADQLEALLRAESVIDKARKALGNSTTARQLRELGMSAGHGVAGAGAVGGLEAIKEHEFEPSHVIAAALVFGAARHGAHVIDDRVARKVGELLVSRDPKELVRGLELVTKNPTLFNALRTATAGAARVGARDIGTRKAAAGIGALFESELGADEGHPRGHGLDALSDQLQ